MRLVPDEILAVITIVQEAASEPYEGQLAVAEVIRRRAERHFQSDGTIAGTVLHSYAFSGWNTKPDFLRIRTVQLQDTDKVVEEATRAWRESVGSNVVPEAVFYYRPLPGISPAWAIPDKFVATIGHHIFFRA